MSLQKILGHGEILSGLQRLVASERLGNSLLFSGREAIGKGLVAEALAGIILGRPKATLRHPDLYIMRPEGKVGLHSVESMRHFSREVYVSPTQAKHKVFILHDADRMLPTSANALLKTLEEPALYAILILISSKPQALLPTILSRCQTVNFKPLAEQDIVEWLINHHSCTSAAASRAAALAQGSLGLAIRLLDRGEDVERQGLFDLLAMGTFSTYHALTEAIKPICDSLDAFKEQIRLQITESFAGSVRDLSAAQKESLEKEVNGAVEIRWREEVSGVFGDILGWYRDLLLLQTGGDVRYLYHRNRSEQLARSLKYAKPLAKVEEAIAATRLSLERSTSLRTCLESLFLTLLG